MPLLIPFLPLIAKLGYSALEWAIHKKGVDAETKKWLINTAEQLRKKGLADVKSRYEAESQIDEIKAEWEKRHEQRKG